MGQRLFSESVAEFIGAFGLMFVGGAAMLHGQGLLEVALAHGVVLAVLVTATLHVSGGQFNPAVSIALAAIRKQGWSRAAVFILAQLFGATVAALALSAVFDPGAVEAGRLGATLGSMSTPDGLPGLLMMEFLATVLLMVVIMGTVVDARGTGRATGVGGFAIGGVVIACILCFGPMTGASMNPCRSFGPALVGGHWDVHWAYWAAPIAGALAAAVGWETIKGDPGGAAPDPAR